MIGLFGLIGMGGITLVPFMGRGIDKLVPWYATLLAIIIACVFQSAQTVAGGINVAAVVITTIGVDISRQMTQVSITTSVFG